MSTLHQPRRTRDGGPAGSGRALARCVPDPEAFVSAWGRAAVHATAAELPHPLRRPLRARGRRRAALPPRPPDAVPPDGEGGPHPRAHGIHPGVASGPDRRPGQRGQGPPAVRRRRDDRAPGAPPQWVPVIEFPGGGRRPRPPRAGQRLRHAPSSRGFSAHYDIHDVFVLQVAGWKRWIVHDPLLRGAPPVAALDPAACGGPAGPLRRRSRSSTSCSGPATRSTCPEGSSTPPRRSATCARISPSGCMSSPGTRWSRRSPRSRSTTSWLRRSLPLGVDSGGPGDVRGRAAGDRRRVRRIRRGDGARAGRRASA